MNEPTLNREIIESLRHGNVPPMGVRAFYQANPVVEKALKEDLRYVAGGGSKAKYVSGRYGSGKSLSLSLARDLALEENFVVSDVVLDPKITPFHKLELVYQSIMKGLCIQVKGMLQSGGQALFYVLSQWKEEMAHGSRGSLDPVIVTELPSFPALVDFLVDEQNLRLYILNWLMGARNVPWTFKKQFRIKGDVDRPYAISLLSAFSKIICQMGLRGWVILFDEAESIMDLPTSDSRSFAYDLLRNIDENKFGLKSTYAVFAGTPEFFTDKDRGIPSFPALDDRISHRWRDVRPTARSPILRLSPLTADEYAEMLRKILNIYNLAYGTEICLSEKEIAAFIKEHISPDAPPREVIRYFIARLDEAAK